MPSKEKRHVTLCCGRKLIESKLRSTSAYRRGYNNWLCLDAVVISGFMFKCPNSQVKKTPEIKISK